MAWGRAALGLAGAIVLAGTLVSGGSRDDSVRLRYLPESNELRTVVEYGRARVVDVRSLGAMRAINADPRWLARALPLGSDVPGWARQMYRRSLLVLRAHTDRRSGAVVAGFRDGWEYVWPRDAGAVAIAFASAGYRDEARRISRFLLGLDLDAAARFYPDGTPVDDRAAQGDAVGWVAAAARAAGLRAKVVTQPWRNRADYQEGEAGDYLGNAITSLVEGEIREDFAAAKMLVREAGDPESGGDSAAAWAVRPFPLPTLYPLVRRTLLRLAAGSGRFGIVPSEGWEGGVDPWTAPTAWAAWSLAALGERRAALHLMTGLHRTETPLGFLPERVDVHTGTPTSTTPLAWSHAFAILAIHQLWGRS